jgi:predicted RNase H-like nuclease
VSTRVLGLDGCREGWVGVFFDGATLSASVRPTLTDFADEDVACIGIDMPIGLPSRGRRRCDEEGKRLLGRRASTLFHVPPRSVLTESTFESANEVHRLLTGQGLTKQSWNLREKILELDKWMERPAVPTYEVHPEISFRKLVGTPLVTKKSFAGYVARRNALAGVGIAVEKCAGQVGVAGIDDVIDAAVVAWSAMEIHKGLSWCLPEYPDFDDLGIPMAIFA